MFDQLRFEGLAPGIGGGVEGIREPYLLPTPTAESAHWLDRVRAAGQVQNRAAAAQLVAVGELFAHRWAQNPGTEQWAVDAMAAVAAEVAAGLKVSQARALNKVRYARAMRERLPQTAQVLCAGDIDVAAFAVIVFGTDAIVDAEVLARVDALIAANVTRWPSLTRNRLAAQVDKIVFQADADAVRRREQRQHSREIWIGPDLEGVAQIEGTLASPDARALDERLSAVAATVCPQDPRTQAQRRADALGALAGGAQRLACRCGLRDCPAVDGRPVAPVVIHVIAEQATLDGTSTTPARQLGGEGLISPELLTELAQSARRVPLTHPGYSPPEPGYTPSKALADFVRSRDLTCRWPGCEVPATRCELDHTVPHAQGGPTHASNLKCYCKIHHLCKTFWGWHDQQLADGTVILTSPAGDTHVTTPGSALLFPSLCHAVGGIPTPEVTAPPADYCAERTAMMPKRRHTRTQDHTTRIAAERAHNRQTRQARHAAQFSPAGTDDAAAIDPNPEPPPF